jgi:elongation factor P
MNIPVRKGMLIRHHDHLYFVEDFHERHTGKQKPTVHVKLKDLKDGRHVERTLDELMPIREVEHSYRTLQYTYHRADVHVFMDTESFDEHELTEDQLHGFVPFLKEGQELRAMFADGRLANLETPSHVSLHVASTAAPERSVGQGGSVMKEAVLENGLTVNVPLFIKNGDLIRVDARDRTYAGKEKETHA